MVLQSILTEQRWIFAIVFLSIIIQAQNIPMITETDMLKHSGKEDMPLLLFTRKGVPSGFSIPFSEIILPEVQCMVVEKKAMQEL